MYTYRSARARGPPLWLERLLVDHHEAASGFQNVHQGSRFAVEDEPCVLSSWSLFERLEVNDDEKEEGVGFRASGISSAGALARAPHTWHTQKAVPLSFRRVFQADTRQQDITLRFLTFQNRTSGFGNSSAFYQSPQTLAAISSFRTFAFDTQREEIRGVCASRWRQVRVFAIVLNLTSASKRRGKNLQGCETFTWKARP